MPIPLFPGVPALPPGLGFLPPFGAPVLLTADGADLSPFPGPSQWGIYDGGGNPVLLASSTASVEYTRDWRISDYPQEQGAFGSYNKVQVPYQGIVTFWVGGSEGERAQFLAAAEPALASLDMAALVMPEISYVNANLTHYSFKREAHAGVTLLRVDVWVEEVRVIGVATFSATQSVNGASTTQQGTVQPQVPSSQLTPGGALAQPGTQGAS